MRLIFVRHGEPRWHDESGLGDPDPPLTERGIAQAVKAAEALQDEKVDALWVSPALRAWQTCQPIAHLLDREPVTRDWLLEVQIPVIGGKTQDEVRKIFQPARRLPVDEWWHGVDGCESYVDFASRVTGGLDAELGALGAERSEVSGVDLWRGLPEDYTVVAVCHAATTAVAVSHLVGLGQVPWSWIRLPVGHAGFAECRSTWMSDARVFTLARLDDREHLTPEERTR